MTVRPLAVHAHPPTGAEQLSQRLLSVGLLPILLVLSVAFMAVFEQKFFGLNNLFNVLRSTSFLAIVAAGQMLVLIVGGFDLSVGAVIALTSTGVSSSTWRMASNKSGYIWFQSTSDPACSG